MCFFSGVWELVWPPFSLQPAPFKTDSRLSICLAIYVQMWGRRGCFHCMCVCMFSACVHLSVCVCRLCVSTHVHLCLWHVFAPVPLLLSAYCCLSGSTSSLVCMCICFVFSQSKPVKGKGNWWRKEKWMNGWCYLFGLADYTFSREKSPAVSLIPSCLPLPETEWACVCVCVCMCVHMCIYVYYLLWYVLYVWEVVCVCVCMCVKQNFISHV